MDKIKEFLTKNNPYAINIIINVLENEKDKVSDYEEYYKECEDIVNKFRIIQNGGKYNE